MNDDEPTDEPSWELLPDHPEEFFCLEDEYDRRELKRAYTRLIKRFKPERCPAEFKRIRAAYEVLDEQLRYGALGSFTESISFDPPADPGRESSESVPAAPRIDAVSLLHDLGPEGARDRLRAVADGDGTDWAHLALLEDVLDADPLRPYRTLLEGVRATRAAPATINLLTAFLHEEIEPQFASTLLVELAAATSSGGLPATQFWFITDHQWMRLIPLVSFDSYAALLDRCIDEVGEGGLSGQLMLLLRLRRRLILRADDAWLVRVDGELVGSLWDMPSWAGDDYDMADWLTAYRDVRDDFVDGSDIRRVLDEAVVAIVGGDDASADRAFLLAKDACIERAHELISSFETDHAATAVVTQILQWYGDEWRERMGIEDEEPSIQSRKSLEFCRNLHRRSGRSFVGKLWDITLFSTAILVVAVILGAAIVPLLTLGHGAWTVTLAVMVGVRVGIRRDWEVDVAAWVSEPFVKRLHRTLWRPMTIAFLEESRVSFEVLIEVLDEDDSSTSVHAHEALDDDHALMLFSSAVRTLV